MKLRARDPAFFVDECAMRLPFRFGTVTLTRAKLLTARVRVESESGASADGFAADLLVPKWFDKDPSKSAEQNEHDLIESARRAAAAFCDGRLGPHAPFELWWRVYSRLVGRDPAPERALVDGFGVALIERALIDGLCRAEGLAFFDALKGDRLEIRPGEVHPELDGFDVAACLPAAPRAEVIVRHTVGMLDPLRSADVAEDQRVGDGLPQALEEDVARHGLTHFKVKIGGDPAADAARLLAVGELLFRIAPSFRFTVDGNEQYRDFDLLAETLHRVAAVEEGRELLGRLLFIEQPLSRVASFQPQVKPAIAPVAAIAPVILDEADFGVDAFPRAIELGWGGISVKNCKGVFRALLNRALCRVRGGGLFQSAEDLTNLPLIALQQDLATIAALDLPHAERNGQHYFRGLDHLAERERAAALALHSDLYEGDAARARLRITDGKLALGSLQCPGYGCAAPFDASAHRALA